MLSGAVVGTVAGVLAGCTSEPEAPPVDPDRLHLEGARDVEAQLLEVLRAAPTGDVPEAAVVAVEQHLTALDAALGRQGAPSSSASASSSTSASPTDAQTGPLRAADRAAAQHTKALRSTSAAITPLLASIAASDAAIAAALRPGAS
jgi:hypothetical protein